jgi:3-hydroxyisobutyrate dehydrogenase-like beta-hydroxyacid dehydrogenase
LNRNIITVNLMEAVGEAQVFAEKTGLGTGAMEELIGEAFGPVAGGYSKRYCLISCFHMH